MGYQLTSTEFDVIFKKLKNDYIILAPKLFTGGGHFSDTDLIRYGEIDSADDIVFDQKSSNSFKEAMIPNIQTLFYFTESTMKESDEDDKPILVFLRSCDLHAVKRLDEIYLKNGGEDFYYRRKRDKIHFVLMGCSHHFDNCFCVDMSTNQCAKYDMSIDIIDNNYLIDCPNPTLATLFDTTASKQCEVTPQYVTETAIKVSVPSHLPSNIASDPIWDEYDSRCIACGRCNFSCPTCSCYSMQDLFYDDNDNVGERRRVWASCMINGFTDVAGGGSYRQKQGQRMRFKVLHKILDYQQRFGYHMCVGCGRCDDACPEYISFSNTINKLNNIEMEG